LFLDFDGVLAPIVDRPDDAQAPEETRVELERLARRYALVAVVSGRSGDDVRGRLGADGVVAVGSHGLELDPGAEDWRAQIDAFADTVDWPDVERKTLTVAFHYRTAADERGARATLEDVARRARAEGLRAFFAGDDTTDLDAFHAVADLELAVRVAVAADESPPELRAAADIVVSSTA